MSYNTLGARARKKVFGEDRLATDNLEAQMLRRVLRRRQCEKIRNYERIAARLEMRGEKDAAVVLFRAAGRLRTIVPDAG